MKAKIYSYASGEQETIAEIELKGGKLVFSGPRADGIRADLSERGLLNIAEGKPSERVRLDNPELLMKNIPYGFLGSLCKAELVGRSPVINRPTIKYTADYALELDGQLEVKIAWDVDHRLYRMEIQKGVYEKNHRRWLDENHELDAVLAETTALQLPLCASGQVGLDGTTYTLRIGCAPLVEYTWWADLPDAWSALSPLVDKIMQVVARKPKRRSTCYPLPLV